VITTNIGLAKTALDNNELVAIPTETVYGLAGNAYNEQAVEKIFALKQRPLFNPLIVHIKSAAYLNTVARDIPDSAQVLAHHFWPGPLTLVLQKQDIIPDLVTAGKATVAIRVPNHAITLDLLHRLEYPLAAPSANPFGSISPTTAQHVHDYFKADLGIVLDGGACQKGIESTIIGFEGNRPIVYRLGSLSIEEIESKVGKVTTMNHDDITPIAPGMLDRHYAPSTDTYLTDDIQKLVSAHQDKKIGLLLFHSPINNAHVLHQEILSESKDLHEAAKHLYAAMHRLDKLNLDIIIAERLPDNGLGKTINDKLQRATK